MYLSFILAVLCSLSFAQAEPLPNNSTSASVPVNDIRVDLKQSKTRLKGSMRHGFRMGYGYINDAESSDTLRTSWLYLVGYELNQTIYGGSWINVLFVENISVVGINQSLFIPSGNILLGFEFNERFQLVSGINMVPTDNWVHMVVAAGWTPKVGDINIPFHVSYVPDYNNNWRAYFTTGVNW